MTEAPESLPDGSRAPLAAAQILIVDDEPANIRFLERLLERAGYTSLHTAPDAPTLLALYDRLPRPDLILLDLHLPRLADGIALLRDLGARTPPGAYIPVLVLTADATSTALHQAFSAGAKDFLRKPLDPQEVLLRIQNLLETRFLHRALQERNRAVTAAVAQAVSGVLADLVARRDVGVAAERIAASVRTLMQTQAARVYRTEPGTGDLVALGSIGEPRFLGPAARMPQGAGVAGRAVRTGLPAASLDLLNDPSVSYPEELVARLRETTRRAALAIPMNVQDRTIGALVLVDDVGRTFSSEDVGLAQAFADQAATVLELARVYDETERARLAAEELARVAKSLTETLDATAIGERVVAAVTSLFQAQHCTLRMLEGEDTLRLIASGGPASHLTRMPRDLPADQGVPGLTLKTGEAVWTPDALDDPRIKDTPELRAGFGTEMRAVLAVPLRVRGVVKGALAISDRVGRRFSDRQVETLQMLADQVALALENARNYQAVQQAYEELSHTNAQLAQAQKMESIGRLAGGIAHDFNNLLTVITGRTALELARPIADVSVERSLELIEATAKRAASLTRQLLAFSRKQIMEPRILDLNATIAGLEPILRRLIGEDLRVVVHRDAHLGRVKADPGQIEQVVLNLTVNARDAMPGGGELTLRTANTVLSPASARQHLDVEPGPYVMLAVSDTGVGMAPEVLTHVFEPFFTTKEPGKGTGLGLATVYGIVKQSGGHVTVESTRGEGTTFKIFLPRVEDEAPGESAPAAASPAAQGYETILLAEDDPDVRELTREILSGQGYNVLPAANGIDALRVAGQYRRLIHLLVTDVIMPEMNGADLARRLGGLRPVLRVLFMSGYTDDVIARERVLEPGTALLEKPFDPADLILKVREVLDGPTGPRRPRERGTRP